MAPNAANAATTDQPAKRPANQRRQSARKGATGAPASANSNGASAANADKAPVSASQPNQPNQPNQAKPPKSAKQTARATEGDAAGAAQQPGQHTGRHTRGHGRGHAETTPQAEQATTPAIPIVSASEAPQPPSDAQNASPAIVPVTTQEAKREAQPDAQSAAANAQAEPQTQAEARNQRGARTSRRGGRGRGRQVELILPPQETPTQSGQTSAGAAPITPVTPDAPEARPTQAGSEPTSDFLSDLFAQAPALIAPEPTRPYLPFISLEGTPTGAGVASAPAASHEAEQAATQPSGSDTSGGGNESTAVSAQPAPAAPKRYRFDTRPRRTPQPAARPAPNVVTAPTPVQTAPMPTTTTPAEETAVEETTPTTQGSEAFAEAAAPTEQPGEAVTTAPTETLGGEPAAEVNEAGEAAELAGSDLAESEERESLPSRGGRGRHRNRRRQRQPRGVGGAESDLAEQDEQADEYPTPESEDIRVVAPSVEPAPIPEPRAARPRRTTHSVPAASAPEEGDSYIPGYAPGYGGYVPGYSGYASANNGATEASAYGAQQPAAPAPALPSYGATGSPYTPGARTTQRGASAGNASNDVIGTGSAYTTNNGQSAYGSPEPAYAHGFAPQPRQSAPPAYAPYTRTGRTTGERNGEAQALSQLNAAVREVRESFQQQTDRLLSEMRRQQMAPAMTVNFPPMPSNERVGVFVDVANLIYSARSLRVELDFGRLLDFLRGNRRLIRAHAYAPTSPEPGIEQSFLPAVKGLGYRITTKNYKTFASGAKKADLDLDMCMDVVRLVEAGALDTVVLVSGDSDFLPLLEYCSDHGVRVEVAAFDDSAALILRQSCDLFINLSLLDEIRV